MTNPDSSTPAGQPRPLLTSNGLEIVCPLCHGQLLDDPTGTIECLGCGKVFEREAGFPNLVIGERFDDEVSTECICLEDAANQYTTEHYWAPLFHRLGRHTQGDEPPTVLSVGCGGGTDIDFLFNNGIRVVGIDPGKRTQLWRTRQHKEALILANGMHMPFADNSFDIAFCGCVFPHVGVVGDSSRVSDTYHEQRQVLASEMMRVLKPGGHVVVSSPNRLFPLDIFHGREPGNYLPRLNPPWKKFLLSLSDYDALFQSAGASKAVALSPQNYWGFTRSKQSMVGNLLGLPVRALFWLVSQPTLAGLRNSPLNPWLIVMAEKK